MPRANEITGTQRDGLLRTLPARFEAHRQRHAGLDRTMVQGRVESNSAKLWSLNEMEHSGGEPDVVGIDTATGECIFVDCSEQSPQGRVLDRLVARYHPFLDTIPYGMLAGCPGPPP
jgi:hypothetical protein